MSQISVSEISPCYCKPVVLSFITLSLPGQYVGLSRDQSQPHRLRMTGPSESFATFLARKE